MRSVPDIVMIKVRVNAPAKINLHLEIGELRDDGYHSLISLVQMVSLWDTLILSSLKDKDHCEITGNFDCPPSQNTIFRAVRLFRKETGIDKGVHIAVSKQIPSGAGLGGGSSDGASTLEALDCMFKTHIARARLKTMAEELGSDVPFFCTSPAAVISGRGEHVWPVEPRSDFQIVLVHPGIHISTSQAYAWYDDDVGRGHIAVSRRVLRERYVNTVPLQWGFANDFLNIVLRRHTGMAKLYEELKNTGADYANLTGSGSAMYGVFSSNVAASNAFTQMKALGYGVWLLNPLERRHRPILE